MLDQHAFAPEAAGLFDRNHTTIGATQAVEDLPEIHAALSKKYADAAPAALGGHRAKAAAAAALAAPMERK